MKRGIVRRGTGEPLFASANRTETRWERLRGLLGRDRLEEQETLWLDRCDSVHTFAMRFAIDLAYVDRAGEIRKIVEGLRPARMSVCWGAASTVEMPAGSIARLGLRTGDRIEFHAPGDVVETGGARSLGGPSAVRAVDRERPGARGGFT